MCDENFVFLLSKFIIHLGVSSASPQYLCIIEYQHIPAISMASCNSTATHRSSLAILRVELKEEK